MSEGPTADDELHFSGMFTRLLVSYVQQHYPPETLVELLERAGEERSAVELCDDAVWSSYRQFRTLLEAAAETLGGLEELRRAVIATQLDTESTAEMMQVLHELGSLGAVLKAGTEADSTFGISRILEFSAGEVGPNEFRIDMRLKDGFEPFKELCAMVSGMHAVSPTVFGLPLGTVTERSCACEGAEWCSFTLSCRPEEGSDQERTYFELRSRLLDIRLRGFQRTVADLVSAPSPKEGLDGVLAATALAVHAPGYLLVVEHPSPVLERRYFTGMDAPTAESMARDLLSQVGEDVPGRVVVDVVSRESRYGCLAVFQPGMRQFLPQERELVRSYAGLVAASLDALTALEEARRQAETARALLDLSSSFPELLTTDDMASALARAVPSVLDCDRVMVLVADEAHGAARIAATHGFPGEIAEGLREAALPLSVVQDLKDVTFYGEDELDAFQRRYGLRVDSHGVATATAPMIANGEWLGALVAIVEQDPSRLHENAVIGDALRGLAGQAAVAIRNARLVEEVRRQALHDGLTGLPNRTLILDRTERALVRARRERTAVAALFIDLDGFKDVNDSLGHAVGDKLLAALAERLRITLRECDTVGRLGGDEFVVIAEGDSLGAGPEVIAERLLHVINEPFVLDGLEDRPLTMTTSIGIAGGDRPSAGELLRDADVALYHAKGAGKNRYSVFDEEMGQVSQTRLDLEMDLASALEERQFFLAYQPIFDLDSPNIRGAEALLRWRHPRRGVVGPDEFIPFMEETGKIVEVGRWVLHEACRQAAAWTDEGHPVGISVNVSMRQLESSCLSLDVVAALERSGLAPSSLTLEITESSIMKDAQTVKRELLRIRELGVRIAVDDFGTGYSSLAYLSQFPIDALKIDKAFIADIANRNDAGALIRTLIELGKALGLTTLAEGIESPEQMALLQREACDSGQGFLLGKPVEADAFGRLLEGQRQYAG